MNLALAVDVGTQSLKTCLLDRQYQILETARVAYSPQVKSKTQVEIDAEDLWRAFVQAVRQLQCAREATVIGFSTLCPSLLPIDAAGTPIAPVILHLDRRSHAQARWALKQVGEAHFLQVAGNLPIPGGISLTSLLWMRDNRPDLYHRPDVTFGHVNTFFMKRLVDRFLIDPSNASFTGLYDTVGYTDWDAGLLQALHVERGLLPEVVMSATVVGELGRGVAAETGLRSGTPVVIGANDTTCATVGADVTREGMLMNTSGTVEIMVLCLNHPLVAKDHLLRTHAYPERWLAMRTVGAGGASLEWFRNTFCREMTRNEFYGCYLVEVLASSRRPDARFLPYLSGDRHRIRQKSGAFTGLGLNTTREDFLLALAEGIVSFQTEGLTKWRKTVPLDSHIYHVGGGASDAYTQYKQRRLKEFQFVQMGETAVLGAARLAFEALEGAPSIEKLP